MIEKHHELKCVKPRYHDDQAGDRHDDAGLAPPRAKRGGRKTDQEGGDERGRRKRHPCIIKPETHEIGCSRDQTRRQHGVRGAAKQYRKPLAPTKVAAPRITRTAIVPRSVGVGRERSRSNAAVTTLRPIAAEMKYVIPYTRRPVAADVCCSNRSSNAVRSGNPGTRNGTEETTPAASREFSAPNREVINARIA